MTLSRPKVGVLIANIGTPDAPTAKALRRYLNEFLSDKRIISLSPLLWQPILKGIILPFRSKSSAKLYKKIWTDQGSPLLSISKQQAEGIQYYLTANFLDYTFKTVLGMRYGKPSIESALESLKNFKAQQIIILPLFPQYSASTSASVFDAVSKQLKQWRVIPKLQFVDHYHDNQEYINALCTSIKKHWKKQHLLFSYHGIPKAYADAGDPYPTQCHRTTELVVKQLNLASTEWSLAFQSRFGPKQWLTPYCVDVLKQLPKRGITAVDVICPGFSADCLETLEEISQTNKALFLKAGGKHYNYIPALNTEPDHITMLGKLLYI